MSSPRLMRERVVGTREEEVEAQRGDHRRDDAAPAPAQDRGREHGEHEDECRIRREQLVPHEHEDPGDHDGPEHGHDPAEGANGRVGSDGGALSHPFLVHAGRIGPASRTHQGRRHPRQERDKIGSGGPRVPVSLLGADRRGAPDPVGHPVRSPIDRPGARAPGARVDPDRRSRSPSPGPTGSRTGCSGGRSPTEQLAHERLGKPTALAVFASDNLSSSAYATEEILRVLIPAIGVAAFAMVVPITIALLVVLAFLILSYLQTIKAYPTRRWRVHRHARQLRAAPRTGRRRRAAHRLHPHRRGVGRRRAPPRSARPFSALAPYALLDLDRRSSCSSRTATCAASASRAGSSRCPPTSSSSTW